jgi:hypothetical protein
MFMGGDIMRRTLATLAGSAALGFALIDAALAEPVDDTLLPRRRDHVCDQHPGPRPD